MGNFLMLLQVPFLDDCKLSQVPGCYVMLCCVCVVLYYVVLC